ncbi:Pre-mRNA-splicing factor slt11 [Bacidia gigantensis]|uniref:Pre-mRNA-splicing factor slt11 n=1 Tax=Bacidia gigantensis TaxID=2732470 RepID=UPI001D05A566|nr:Pre-mRNA-splicing factor slt11 [Bacidia gigantensis]KAG8530089.1 Pre-mRNA-splicing factor slt11 [Bacidia gigantensis]
MPPQIKQDLNRSGWESTDFPSVCENCLPDNPYVQMLKQDHGLECKICTRPFSVFTWKPDRTTRSKRTNICLTCARTRNCCQSCLLDLSFGLPITIRDAALKLAGSAPNSGVNREYYAQNNEKALEDGVGLEEFEKEDEKGRDLLRKLAQSEPYYRKQRRIEAAEGDKGGSEMSPSTGAGKSLGPVRTSDSRASRGRGGARGGRAFPGTTQLPPQPRDWEPPRDRNVLSLFVTGVEDDLPEHAIRTFFAPFGALRSIVCSHRSHCAFINYATRDSAEVAADHCRGRAIIQGVPLRVTWGKPKALDHLDTEERMAYARSGRETARAVAAAEQSDPTSSSTREDANAIDRTDDLGSIALPPGQGDVQYASLAGDG